MELFRRSTCRIASRIAEFCPLTLQRSESRFLKRQNGGPLLLLWFTLVSCFASAMPHPAGAVSSYQVDSTDTTEALHGDTNIGLQGDDVWKTIDLPFPLRLYNESFTKAEVTSNGVLSFGMTSTSAQNSALPAPAFPPSIFAYWHDLSTRQTGDGIFVNTSGTAPHRVFAVRWNTVSQSNTAEHQDFEVRLHEGTSDFEILYARLDGTGGTVGVQYNTEDFLQVQNLGSQLNFTLKPPAFSVEDVTVPEDTETHTAFLQVHLFPSSSQLVTIQCITVDGSAHAGSDYNAVPLTLLTFAPGQTTKTVKVKIINDAIDEPDETFSLKLSSPAGGVINDGIGVCTILDNDTSVISATGARVWEGNSGTTILNFALKLSVPNSRDVKVTVKTINGATPSAAPGTDYAVLPNTRVTIPAGQLLIKIPVLVNGDLLDEPDEKIGLALNSVTNALLGSGTPGVIADDDVLPSMRVRGSTVNEGDSGTVDMTFTVTLSAPYAAPVTAHYKTLDNTAQAGPDFIPVPSGKVSFQPGETSKALHVAVIGDTLDEADESFLLEFSSPSNAVPTANRALGRIIDDDTSVISVAGSEVTEGNSGTTPMNFTLQLSAPNSRTVTVNICTSKEAVAPATPNVDYEAIPVTRVSFVPGEITKTIAVNVLGDTRNELEQESIGMTLLSPTNAAIGSLQPGVIVDDDPIPRVFSRDVIIEEGKPATVTFTLSAPSGRSVSFDYTTVDHTTTAGADYEGATGTLVFAPGQTSRTLTFGTYDDDLHEEAEEWFEVVPSNPIGVDITWAAVPVFLRDFDNLPPESDGFPILEWHHPHDTLFYRFDIPDLAYDPDGDYMWITSCSLEFADVPSNVDIYYDTDHIDVTIYDLPGHDSYVSFTYVVTDGRAAKKFWHSINWFIRGQEFQSDQRPPGKATRHRSSSNNF